MLKVVCIGDICNSIHYDNLLILLVNVNIMIFWKLIYCVKSFEYHAALNRRWGGVR